MLSLTGSAGSLRPRKRVLVCCVTLTGLILASCNNKKQASPHRVEVGTERQHAAEHRETLPPGSVPNSRLTPGATLDVTKEDICTVGYTKKVRDVPVSVKRQVYAEYGTPYVRGMYEVDHLIPLELGGSNSIRNLWPEPYNLVWGAHVKDQLENRLHELVCQGSVPLATAQNRISQDWVQTYQQVFHSRTPLLQEKHSRTQSTRKRRNEY